MKKVLWQDRQVGDIFLAAVPGGLHNGIWAAECIDHPNAPQDFQVTHAGIVGPVTGWITEAWMALEDGINSVASVVEDAKYEAPVGQGQVELWRPDATAEGVFLAFGEYLAKYVPRQYGYMDLFGFLYRALIKRLTGKDVDNPIECSEVCSQGATEFLKLLVAHGSGETWVTKVEVRNEDPLALRLDFIAHAG